MRAEVAERLETIAALNRRVFGAAKLAEWTKEGAQIQPGISAFVVPMGLRFGKADAVTGLFRQSVDRLITVVLIVRNVGDATGDKAMQELDPLIEAVIQLLAGWAPDDDSFGVLVPVNGELVSIRAGTITYQLDFGIDDQLRIERP